jgi:hypothetical protein
MALTFQSVVSTLNGDGNNVLRISWKREWKIGTSKLWDGKISNAKRVTNRYDVRNTLVFARKGLLKVLMRSRHDKLLPFFGTLGGN